MLLQAAEARKIKEHNDEPYQKKVPNERLEKVSRAIEREARAGSDHFYTKIETEYKEDLLHHLNNAGYHCELKVLADKHDLHQLLIKW